MTITWSQQSRYSSAYPSPSDSSPVLKFGDRNLFLQWNSSSSFPISTHVVTYNPSTNTVDAIGPIAGFNSPNGYQKAAFTICKLADDRVLVTGGVETASQVRSTTTWIVTYNFANSTASWATATSIPYGGNWSSSCLLPDGRVFVTSGGGYFDSGDKDRAYLGSISGNTIAWTQVALPAGFWAAPTVLTLPDGRILFLASTGSAAPDDAFVWVGTVSGDTVSWTQCSVTGWPYGSQRYGIGAALMNNGDVLVYRAFGSSVYNHYSLSISGTSATFSLMGAAPVSASNVQAVHLSDNRVLTFPSNYPYNYVGVIAGYTTGVPFSASGSASASFSGAAINARSFGMAGVAGGSFDSRTFSSRSFSAAGIGAASFSANAIRTGAFNASGVAFATFSGGLPTTPAEFHIYGTATVDAVGGAVAQRSFSAAGAAGGSFAANVVQRTSFSAAGAAGGSFATNVIQRASFGVQGAAQASFAGAKVLQARFNAAGVAGAYFAATPIRAAAFAAACAASASFASGAVLLRRFSASGAGALNAVSMPTTRVDPCLLVDLDVAHVSQHNDDFHVWTDLP